MSPASVSHLGNFLTTFLSLQAGAVAWTQNAYLFEQVGPQPKKRQNKKSFKPNKPNSLKSPLKKISILFLGLTLKSGFLKGKQDVLPIGFHNIVSHFFRKLISCAGFGVFISCAVYTLRQHQQLISFISSPKEYTARVLCLTELNFYFNLQQSLEITTSSSLEAPFIVYKATALVPFCSSCVLTLLSSLKSGIFPVSS